MFMLFYIFTILQCRKCFLFQDQACSHMPRPNNQPYLHFFFEVSFIHNDLHCIVQEEIMLQLSNDSLGTDLLWE